MSARIVVAVAVLVAALSGCASGSTAGAPKMELHIVSSDLSPTLLRYGGRMNAQLDIEVGNPTDAAVMLRSVEINTVGDTSFSLRTGQYIVNRTIAPHERTTVKVSGWGVSAGGRQAEEEPITFRGMANFASADGKSIFHQMFVDTLGRNH